jgi:LPS export ABC transporter protein LptC
MMKILKIIVFLSILACLSSCEEKKVGTVNKVNDSTKTDNPDQISWDIKVNFIDTSFTKAILKADKARIYQKRAETLLDGHIRLEFFSKITGRRVSILTADSARIDDKTRDMFARGNVVVVSDSNQTRLVTNLLQWNNKDQKLMSNAFVRISSPKETLQGYGFESDLNLSNYKIFKVTGEQR